MVQGYYTLEEAAQVVGMKPEDLRQMAQKNQIRSFQDRGTLRFRIQDIQELARQRGASSNDELPLPEPPPPKTPKAGKQPVPETFDFALDQEDPESIDLGREPPPSVSPSKPPSSRHKKSGGPDSDVRLPAEGSFNDLQLVGDGGLVPVPSPQPRPKSKMGGPASPAKPTPQSKLDPPSGTQSRSKLGSASSGSVGSGTGSRSKLGSAAPTGESRSKLGAAQGKSKLGAAGTGDSRSKLGSTPPPVRRTSGMLSPKPQPIDSGVRLVPLDSDVKILGASSEEISLEHTAPSATDSDIRLERHQSQAPDPRNMLLTEEINLDEELKRQEESQRQAPQAKVKPKSALPDFAGASPFELSTHDLDEPGQASKDSQTGSGLVDSSDFDLTPKKASDSSDFDLAPAPGGSSDFDMDIRPKSDEAVSYDLVPDQEGTVTFQPGGAQDDFSLVLDDHSFHAQISDEMPAAPGADDPTATDDEFSLPLAPTTPRPKPRPMSEPVSDSSEDFELSLDDDATMAPSSKGQTSSEFELTLDPGQAGAAASGSDDSEFELTLDDSSQLVVEESGQDKDIFETDFDVPGLEEESGSQVVALDTDLESSNFEFEVESDDMSGSMVVALDEEEVSAGGAKLDGDQEGFEFDQYGQQIPVEEEDEPTGKERVVVKEKFIKPAPWGPLPVFFMLPCAILMFMVVLLGFELVQSAAGFKSAGFLTKTVASLFGHNLK